MNIKIDNLIGQAIQLFQAGNYSSSEKALKYILAAYPRHAPALHIMGLVNVAQNKHSEASTYFKKAVQITPQDGGLQYNLAKCLLAMGMVKEALAHHDKAIKIFPESFDAWFDYAKSLMALNMGLDALQKLEKVLNLKSDHVEAWLYRGIVLAEQGRYSDAIDSYDRAIVIRPDYVEAWSNRGIVLAEQGRYSDAIDSYDRAIVFRPDYAEAWSNRGIALAGLFAYEEAEDSYCKAIKFNPSLYKSYLNYGLLLAETKQYLRAAEALETSLDLMPNNPEAAYNLGLLRLLNFQFQDGWRGYESRFETRFYDSPKLETSKPSWDGRSKAGRLYIWSEQGIGDQILHGSMFKDLDGLIQRITISLDKRLIPLFQRSFPKYSFVDNQIPIASDCYDEQIPLASLGGFFRKKLSDFDRSINPFLKVKPQTCLNIIKKSPKDILCGLSWSSINPLTGDAKSAKLASFLPILKMDNLSFISLQYGDTKDELGYVNTMLGGNVKNVDGANFFLDIDSLASIIETCDLLITTSNSTAHLAGAIGKETLLLLPYSIGKLWYWHEISGVSLWYPSIKIFKQQRQGDWSEPIQAIKEYLGNRFVA